MTSCEISSGILDSDMATAMNLAVSMLLLSILLFVMPLVVVYFGPQSRGKCPFTIKENFMSNIENSAGVGEGTTKNAISDYYTNSSLLFPTSPSKPAVIGYPRQ
jgi:hypothetical protein